MTNTTVQIIFKVQYDFCANFITLFVFYSFVGYKLRNELAAIDFNKHRDRQAAKTADGKARSVQFYVVYYLDH